MLPGFAFAAATKSWIVLYPLPGLHHHHQRHVRERADRGQIGLLR